MARRSGFTLLEVMIVIAMIAILFAIAVPALIAAQRSSNERSASASLRTVAVAEADFRGNDRDNNGIRDFWTADLFALYGLIPPTSGSTSLPTDTSVTSLVIKLIEPSLASADAASLTGSYGNVSFSASIITGSPKAGYVYRAFLSEDAGGGVSTTLLNDTDGSGRLYGSVHDTSRFAFMAAPDTLSSGKLLFIVNEDSTIWKFVLPGTYLITYTAIAGSTDSSSSISGTGSAIFDGATTFPVSPGSVGCSKLD